MRRRGAWIVMVGLVAALLPGPSSGQDPDEGSRRVDLPDDPAGISAALAREAVGPGQADGVVLARDDAFPDSLSAGALAGDDRPILLVPGGPDGTLPEATAALIGELTGGPQGCEAQSDEVTILGGAAAVGEGIADAVRELGYCVLRVFGAGREETSVQAAQQVLGRQPDSEAVANPRQGGPVPHVLLARSDNPADSATAGAYAAASGVPILVTPQDLLHPAVETFLTDNDVQQATILGGTAAISEEVFGQVAALVDTADRVAGPTRDATAAEIARQLWAGQTALAGPPFTQIGGGGWVVNGFGEDAWRTVIPSAVPSARLRYPVLYSQRLNPGGPLIALHDDLGLDTFVVAGGRDDIRYEPATILFDPLDVSEELIVMLRRLEDGIGVELHPNGDTEPTDPLITGDDLRVGGILQDRDGVLIIDPQPEEADTEITIVDESGQPLQTLQIPGNVFGARPSPDGDRFASAVCPTEDVNSCRVEVYEFAEPFSSSPLTGTAQVFGGTFPASEQPWLGDSRRLLVNNLAGEIHIVDLTGEPGPQQTVFLGTGNQAAAQPTTPERADDGWVLVLDPERTYQISATGFRPDRVLPRFQSVPRWSGDGMWFFGFDGQTVFRCDPIDTCDPIPGLTVEGIPRIEVNLDGSRLGITDTGPDDLPRVRVIELDGVVIRFLEEPPDATDVYTRPLCSPYQPILDTNAFATCP